MACWCTLHDFTPSSEMILLPVMAFCIYNLSDFLTDLMYLSSTTSIGHVEENVVKSITYLMYLNHSTSICCIRLLVVKSTSAVHLGIRYSKKSYHLQQKYLQCRTQSQAVQLWLGSRTFFKPPTSTACNFAAL